MANKLIVAPAPHVQTAQSTTRIMRDVVIALMPALVVSTVVFGLDATPALVREAVRLHAQLIVTHHPFIFHALKRINYHEPQGRTLLKLTANRVCVIAAHTNWDKAPGGISDSLAQALGLTDVSAPDEFLRLGTLSAPLSPGARAG